jgi:hypothetical protein
MEIIYAVVIGVSCGVPEHPMYDACFVRTKGVTAEEVGQKILEQWPNTPVIINDDDMPEDEFGNIMWLESVKECPESFAIMGRDILELPHYVLDNKGLKPYQWGVK